MKSYYKKTGIWLATLFLSINLFGQTKKLPPSIYISNQQKVIKSSLADMSEETIHEKVIVKILLNKWDFTYPNHEHPDVHVTMTEVEWRNGIQKGEDFAITSSPDVKNIYFMRDKMEIWVDFTNGETIFYLVKPLKSSAK